MNALTIIQEYGPQALAAVGGAAGVAKCGAWVVGKVLEKRAAKRTEEAAKRAAEKEFRDEMRSGLKACTDAVLVLSTKLDEHDKRTKETADVVRDASREISELRGEMQSRMSRAENDASVARHVASEANALAANAHHRLDQQQHQPRTLDTVTPFPKQRSRG